MSIVQKLALKNEELWSQMGAFCESLGETERAQIFYENALRNNPNSIQCLQQIAALCQNREQYAAAVEYFQQILNLEPTNGEVWGAIGHCNLMMDELQKAYSSYQQALYHLSNPKEPKLWYGIGILYDRYGSYDHAEEAFTSVVALDPDFEKANEIYFRLGIIYKQQHRYDTSLSCFRYILSNPPKPLSELDIWFQIGHVHEQKKEFLEAKKAYEKVLAENPNHSKVLQQLGWLYHQENSGFTDQETAISFLTRSLEADLNDAQTWYLLGRGYMAQQKYIKAYDAYQQAVYREGRNPTFWCSIGVLYYKINQYPDALDAYTRAIHLNPYISEVWYDLGTLYESCNNQISDALDAYSRALELDPNNPHIKQTIETLKKQQASGVKSHGQLSSSKSQISSNLGPNGVHTSFTGPNGPPKQIRENAHSNANIGARPPQMELRQDMRPVGGATAIERQQQLPSMNTNNNNNSPPSTHHSSQRERL
ncbi:hypothetical protein HK099_000684 [Clydaea vesicula]|uniref:Uncharacterized protein n=1 Tax=Clydaea vesicula TaxID=447962 RepID=A0AAD5U4B7_9FUNG|nr:hypothetical protein HK099_000684 [Clydaea vesicula]